MASSTNWKYYLNRLTHSATNHFPAFVVGYQRRVTDQASIPLSAIALVCSLKPSPAPSSSQLMAEHLLSQLHDSGVVGEVVRCVDFDITPGVQADMGDGDQCPNCVKRSVLQIFWCSPRRRGWGTCRVSPSVFWSVWTLNCPRPMIRVGLFWLARWLWSQSWATRTGRTRSLPDAFQGLNDVGYTIPAQGCTYWNGAAHGEDGLQRPQRGARGGCICDRGGRTQSGASGPNVAIRGVSAVPQKRLRPADAGPSPVRWGPHFPNAVRSVGQPTDPFLLPGV